MHDYIDYLPEGNISHLKTPSGGDAANQVVIDTVDSEVFYSYGVPIAIKIKYVPEGEPTTIIGKYWDYSATTQRYLKQFTGNTASETRALIKDGTYQYEEDMG